MVDRYTTSVLAIIAAALVAITAQDGAGFAFADVDYNQCVRDAATSCLRGDHGDHRGQHAAANARRDYAVRFRDASDLLDSLPTLAGIQKLAARARAILGRDCRRHRHR